MSAKKLSPKKKKDKAVPTSEIEQESATVVDEHARLEAGVIDESELTEVKSSTTDDAPKGTSTPFNHDMEAAMEEDIAGESLGVSRRNPELSANPALGFYETSMPPASSQLRSGSEEADWFNSFRERLASENRPDTTYATAENGSTMMADATEDPQPNDFVHAEDAQEDTENDSKNGFETK